MSSIKHDYRNTVTALLADIANELSSVRDWESHLQNSLNIICDAMLVDTAALGVRHGGWKYFLCPEQADEEELELVLAANYSYFSGSCPHPHEQETSSLLGVPGENTIVMPVTGADEVLGVLQITFVEAVSYSIDDVQTLATVASLLGSYLKSVETVQAETRTRQEAEESRNALKDSEGRLRLTTKAANVGTWEWNIRTGELSWDLRSYELLGLPPNVETSFDVFFEVVHPDDRQRVSEAIRRVLDERAEYDIDYRVVHRDGTLHWLHAMGRAFYDESGEPVRALGAGIDVTERKLAEQALKESEERLRLTTEASGIATWEWQMQTWALTWDQHGYELLDLPPGTEQSFEVFMNRVHPDDREHVEEALLHGFRDHEEYDIQYRVVHSDESVHWLHAKGRAYYDESGEPIRTLGIVIDITERKQAQEQAEFDRRRLETVLETMPSAVVIIEALDGNFSYINRRAAELFGFDSTGLSLEENVARVMPKKLDGSPYPTDELPVQHALKGQQVRDIEMILERPDGTSYFILGNASPIFNARGRPVAAVVVFDDATERKRAEQEREQFLEREHHIAETLQQALVPQNVISEIDGYKIAVKYRAALREAEIGGDFYDVFDLGGGRIGILIGDVAGKGLPAAIRVAAARYTIRGYAYLDVSPRRVMELANNSLNKDELGEGSELTALFAVLNVNIGSITFTSAGHEPPILAHKDGSIEELYSNGVMLSVIANATYEEKSCILNPGDRLVVITDGITEARNEDVELFGKSGVIDYIKQNSDLSAQELADGLLDAATEHAGGRLQDDAAILIIERQQN